MTVQDLIEELMTYNPEAKIIMAGHYGATSSSCELEAEDEKTVVIYTGICTG